MAPVHHTESPDSAGILGLHVKSTAKQTAVPFSWRISLSHSQQILQNTNSCFFCQTLPQQQNGLLHDRSPPPHTHFLLHKGKEALCPVPGKKRKEKKKEEKKKRRKSGRSVTAHGPTQMIKRCDDSDHLCRCFLSAYPDLNWRTKRAVSKMVRAKPHSDILTARSCRS